MDSTRQIHVIPPRAYLNDPTVLGFGGQSHVGWN